MINLDKYYNVSVEITPKNFAEHLEWCFDHCSGNFRDIRLHGTRTWFFENEKDAIMFSLKWSGRK